MKILDPACGSKMFWFDKHEPHTTYTDIRDEELEVKDRDYTRRIEIKPDRVADFKFLPYRDFSFNLIIFDPPHLHKVGKTSWLAKKYGRLDKDTWRNELRQGFKELWRVLALDGVLLFKWSDTDISFKEVLELVGHKPILGDKRGHTRWFVFIKPNRESSLPSIDPDLVERGVKHDN